MFGFLRRKKKENKGIVINFESKEKGYDEFIDDCFDDLEKQIKEQEENKNYKNEKLIKVEEKVLKHFEAFAVNEAVGIACDYNEETSRETIENDYLFDMFFKEFANIIKIINLIPYDKEKAIKIFNEEISADGRNYLKENCAEELEGILF